MPYKLGRKAPDYSKPRLWLDDYVTDSAALPPLAASVDYCSHVTSWPMYLNDQLGDCTCAGAAHAIGAWTQYAQGTEATFADADVLTAYEGVSGYVPGEPSTDQGATLQGVLSYWQSTGIGGHKIQTFAQLREVNELALNQALQLFGSVYLGLNLPQSAEDQFRKQPWTYVKGSPIIGGHCVVLQGFQLGSYGDYSIITWGSVQRASLQFMRTYCEEAWVALSPDWLTAQGGNINGVDVATLTTDMGLL